MSRQYYVRHRGLQAMIYNTITMNHMLLFLSVLCGITCVIQGAVQEVPKKQVAENGSITIQYETTANPQDRYWYHGYWNSTNTPNNDALLFTLMAADTTWTKSNTAHGDMSADPDNYSLTISKVRLEDDGFYTCMTVDKDKKDFYDIAKEVQVYSKSYSTHHSPLFFLWP